MKLDEPEPTNIIDPKAIPPAREGLPTIAETETIMNIPALIILLIVTLFCAFTLFLFFAS